MPDYFDPEILGRVKGYELRSLRLVESLMVGLHKSRLLGISTEFAQHRQYVPGDETRHLDWKVFAKTDRFYVRQYEAETNMRVVFLIDTSRSMFFRSERAALGKFEYAAVVVAVLSRLLARQQDACGLVLFDKSVRTYLPPRSTESRQRDILAALEGAQPADETDLAETFATLVPRLPRRCLLVVLSDFLTGTDTLGPGIGQIAFGQHDLILMHVEDPQERDFRFVGQTEFRGPEGEGRLRCDPRDLRHAYLTNRKKHLAKLHETARQFGYDLEPLPTDGRIDEALARFLAVRGERRRR